MRGIHNQRCLRCYPNCQCLTCAHDGSRTGTLKIPCCGEREYDCCPMGQEECEDYEEETPIRGLRALIPGIIDEAMDKIEE